MSKLAWTQNANDASAEDDRKEGIERRDKKNKRAGCWVWPYKTMLLHKETYVESCKISISASTEDIRSEQATQCYNED